MGTVRLGVFPSINNKITQDKIATQVCQWFIKKFPTSFFSHVYIDTQNKNASQYAIDKNGEFTKWESGQKILQPNIRFTVEEGANNIKDAFNGIYNVNMKPGAFGIDTDLTGYKPIYEDCYGSILSVNDYPIRNNFNIKITLQTKADQLAIANILNSNFKAGINGDIIICDTVIPIPDLLMEYFRSCFFKPEILNLSKIDSKSDDYSEYKKNINQKFTEFIYRFSNGAIKPYKSSTTNSSFIYGYERKQRVYVRLEEPELDTGTKKGNVYDHFTVELSGYIDYANLVSFITSVPAIIRGTKNNWYLKTSDNKDKNLYYSMMKFKEVYRETRLLEPISDKYIHFYLERELLMSKSEESFDLLDEILVEKQFPAHYHVLKALLSLIQTKEQFNELFKVCIYKNKFLIDDYEIDEKFHIKVHNCDLSVPYYIDIFLNKNVYYNYIEKMKNVLSEYEINWSESNVNTNRGYNNNLLSGTYRGQIIKSHNDIQLDPNYIGRDISQIYNSTNPNRGSNWNINFEGSDIKENAYMPIKDNLYLVPDPSYKYYLKETQSFNYEKPKLVKDKTLTTFDSDTEYYYYNTYGELVKVVSPILVKVNIPKVTHYILTEDKYPDKKKDYYLRNKNGKYTVTRSFSKTVNFDNNYKYFYKNEENDIVEVEKTRVFDKKKTYYTYNSDEDKYLENVNLKSFEDNIDYFYKDSDGNYIKVEPEYIFDSNYTYFKYDSSTDSYLKVKLTEIFTPNIEYFEKITDYNFDNDTVYYYYEDGELVELDTKTFDKSKYDETYFYTYKENEPDPNTDYYHYVMSYTKDVYIPVDTTNGFNINKDYYILDEESGEGLKIDINKVLVPNPNFKYYIQDKDSNFREIKNISEFQENIQYYTSIYDKDIGNIIITVKE